MNEFWGLVNFNRWVKSPSGKSFRTKIVKNGMYVMIHRNTGNFFVGKSNKVSEEVDRQIDLLNRRKHKIKFFNRIMELDDQLEILEMSASVKEVKSNIKLMEHKLPTYYNYLWKK